MLTGRAASFRAHLRSHSGLNAGIVLFHAPTAPEYTVPPHLFRVILLERLALPLPVNEARCDACHEPLDTLGRHLAACPRTGRLRKRASPIERMLARICREAGARVRFNASLRDMNVHVRADDERRIEVLAQDLPCFGGAQLAIDVTLRSALRSSGEPQPHAADVDGAILLEARRDKEATYPELASSTRCRLVVLAVETGGRWREAIHLVWQLALAKARDVPHFLTQQVALAWERRWTRMLSTVRHIFCHVSGGSSVARNDVRDSRGCAIDGRHFVS